LGASQNGGNGGAVIISTGAGGAATGSSTAGTAGVFGVLIASTVEFSIDYNVTTASTVTWIAGDSAHNLVIEQPGSGQTSPANFTIQSGVGYSVAATVGSNAGTFFLTAGNGGAGQGTNHTGGIGGSIEVSAGAGGAATGTAANAYGGNVYLNPGAAGTGGSGAAGVAGSVIVSTFGAGLVQSNGGGSLSVIADGTNAYVLTMVGGVPAWAAAGSSFTAGGDLSGTSSSQTVIGLQGNAVANTAPTDTYVLTWSAGSSHWYPAAAAGGSVTWANDLTGSSSTHQYVYSISGPSGAGGTVNLGDGVHGLNLWMDAATTGTPPTLQILGAQGVSTGGPGGQFFLFGGNGWGGASIAGLGGTLSFAAGSGAAASSGTATGGQGGDSEVSAGNGGAGFGSNQNGGPGGSVSLSAGKGGNPTGSGAAGAPGVFNFAIDGQPFGFCGAANDATGGFIQLGATGAGYPTTGVFRATSATGPTLTHYDLSYATSFEMVSLGNPLGYGVGPVFGDNSVSSGTVIQTTSSTPIALMIGSTAYFGIATGFLGGGHGEAWFGNGTAPGSNPTGGYYVYANAGALFGRGSSGTITTIGVADLVGFMDTPGHGHCPECGTDFAHEWQNDAYGSLTVCMTCLTEEIGERPWIIRKKAA
jgi:hypothetical protein